MKVAVEQSEIQIYHLTPFGTREFDVPEAQAHWISEVFENFYKAQEYLTSIYRQGPVYNRT